MTTITKRNGKTVPFNPDLIKKAIYGAFWEEENEKRSTQNLSPLPKGSPLPEQAQEDIELVTNNVLSTLRRKECKTVEEIQDLVEKTLYVTGFDSIGRKYVTYRADRKKHREETERRFKISITKSTGEVVPFQIEPLEEAIESACRGIEDVNPKTLLAEAEKSLYDKVRTFEITNGMIQAAKSFIGREPNYSFVAGRLLLQKVADECLGELGLQYHAKELPVNYTGYFTAYIKKGIELGHLLPALADYDLAKLEAALVPGRDLLFEHMGLQTLYDRYLIKTKHKKRIEMPQAFWMRVAMGLAILEKNKEEKAIEFYNVLSQLEFVSSTPTLFNAGTPHQQLSSCYLGTVPDDITQIFKNYSDNAHLSKWAGGIGTSWTPVRGTGAYIKGTNGESQGLIPWLKIQNDVAVAVNQGSKRKGAICGYLEPWHIDIESFADLRKETGDDRLRAHDLFIANWLPDLFLKRIINKEDWWLFSPDKTPDLHENYGKAFDELYAKYEAIAEAGPLSTVGEDLGTVTKSKPEHPLHPCKKVPADALWKKLLSCLFETGHPWMTFKDPGNIRSPQDHVGIVHSSNLCCMAKDQRVVTSQGIKTVESLYATQTPNIVMGRHGALNASHMLLPRPNAPMVRIVTEEGYTHKVTPDHKVGVVGGLQKEAQNLSEGDRIELQQKEGLFGPNDMEDEAFLVGLIAADGGIGETAYIDIWQDKTLHLAHEIEGVCARVLEKYENILDYDNHPQTGRSSVLPYRKPTFGETTKPSTQKRRLTSTALKVVLEHLGITAETKLQVPEFVWEGNKKTVQAYIRGAILCDGSPQATEEITTVQWGSISQTWLEEIQILLINLGIKSSIKPMREAGENLLPDGKGGHKLYSVQKLYRLLITSVPACKLLEEATHLGKERNHLQYLHNLQTKEGYTQKMHATFSHLEPLPNEDAYCLQVDSEEHLWVVNGILTRNTEIFLNTSPSKVDPVTHGITEPGEWAVCNLGSINLVKHLHEGKIDKTKLKNTVRTAIRMLDNVIDINFYPIWEAEVANKRHRPIGLGVMGFHSTIMENNIAFDSPEAVEVADVYQELISLYAIEASSDLAVERGSYQSFKGSKWDRGLLPLDTIALLKQERGEQWCSIDESSQFPQEWERIREKIKTQGMRNSNTMAIAPTATISNICGVSEGIMPEASAIYRKENLSGGFPIVNKILVRKLKSLGLWEGEIIEAIKIADGSIQHISAIPEDVRRVYKTQFEIDPAYLIECASRRQKWIDMGQSLNLYIDKPNGRKLSNMYLLAWAKGLKSTYYLRSSGASQREKTSVEVQKTPEAQACSIEAARRGEVCEACQ